MKTKKSVQTFLILSLFTFSLLLPASALAMAKATTANQDKGNDTREVKGNLEMKKADIEDKQQQAQEKRTENIQNNCENMQNRIQTRIKNFGENKENHIAVYNGMLEKLDTAVKALGEKGYDTTIINNDIKVLDGLAKKYASEYEYFISLLSGTEKYACGESNGEYKNAYQEARGQLQIAKDARKNIVDFYKEVIRTDIQKLREQTPTGNQTRSRTSSSLGL